MDTITILKPLCTRQATPIHAILFVPHMTTYQIITQKTQFTSFSFQTVSTHNNILTFKITFPHNMWRNKLTDKDIKWINKLNGLLSLVYLHFPIIAAEKISAVAQHWTHWHRLTATSQSSFSSWRQCVVSGGKVLPSFRRRVLPPC
jgi:hypothetical protein